MVRSDIFTVQDFERYRRLDGIIEFIYRMILIPKGLNDGKEYIMSKQQEELILSVWGNKKTTCRSGRGVGKTCGISWLSIAFETLYPEAKVFLTAPSSKTLKSALIPEIKKWIVGSYLEDLFNLTAEKIYLIEDKSGNSFIEGRTANKENPEAMSGLHSPNMLILCDEASNVPDEIIRTLTNTLTQPNNRICLISNPTRNIGEFYDSHCNDNLNLWNKLHFSSEDSPQTSKETIAELEDKWGRDHNIFKIDVAGIFPDEDESAFIGMSKVAAAMDRDVEPDLTDIHIGVDVARYGSDKTCLFWRAGNAVYEPVFAGKTSTVETAEMTLQMVRDIRSKTGFQGVIKVKIDDGGVGGGVTDLLDLDRDHNIEIFPCNFGGAGDEKCANAASIMWNNLRDKINFISLPGENECQNVQTSRMLKEELSARRVSYATGKIKIEPKDIFKKDFGRSPDFADALVLCFYDARSTRAALKNFDPVNEKTIIKRLGYLTGYEVYASVFYSRDRLVSFLIAKWGNGELFVTHESIDDTNISNLAFYIKNINPMGYKKIIGNDRCFGKHTRDDVRGQLRKFGVRLRENPKYDEIGALELLNELNAKNKLKLSYKCPDTKSQLYNWRLDRNAHELETEYGLCYALLNLVSELKTKIKKSELPEPVLPDYGQTDESENNYQKMHSMHVRSMS